MADTEQIYHECRNPNPEPSITPPYQPYTMWGDYSTHPTATHHRNCSEAARYCDEVTYSVSSKPGSSFFAIGFKNNSDGYVLRSKVAKICSSSDVTTLGPDGKRNEEANSKKVAVFEGFIDFLSLLSYNEKDIPGHDCCILNSVSNLERALPWIARHKEIMVFADNDNAGRETLQKITDFVSGSSEEISIYDMAELYKGHKDVNDKLVEEMTKTNPSSGSDI